MLQDPFWCKAFLPFPYKYSTFSSKIKKIPRWSAKYQPIFFSGIPISIFLVIICALWNSYADHLSILNASEEMLSSFGESSSWKKFWMSSIIIFFFLMWEILHRSFKHHFGTICIFLIGWWYNFVLPLHRSWFFMISDVQKNLLNYL